MSIEIERKFLLADDRWRRSVHASRRLRQGYLSDAATASVRVRVDEGEANLNIKAAVVGIERSEFEYPIPLADAEAMLRDLCLYPPVEKLRHLVDYAGHTWEIDEFDGANAGLVVAEIELAHANEVFETPPWLGREVSGERRYFNHALAAHPYREWRDAG